MPDFLTLPALVVVPPGCPLTGKAAPPGSKSVTNRVLLLAALSHGKSNLTGALKSDDTARMAEALRAMGVVVEEPDSTSFLVTGNGVLSAPEAPLFLGNAGTATRFLTAATALANGTVIVDGDEHMRKRPIAPLVEALKRLGIDAEAPSGCPPVTVKGTGGFEGGTVSIDAGLSSQYVSALLMLAPRGRGPTDVVLEASAEGEIGARGYIDLTIASMRHFGAQVDQTSPGHWQVKSGEYTARDTIIEPDASAATYLWAAAVLTGGNIDIGTAPQDFTQPDACAHKVIAAFPDMPAEINGSQMQDAVPTLAVLAAYNKTPVRFIGIANLRVKECDRIRALSEGLNRIRSGLAVEEGDDLIIASDPGLAGQTVDARIETFSDHRIAMSFALAGLLTHGITILNPGCVAKTFPAYWDVMASLGVSLQAAAVEPGC